MSGPRIGIVGPYGDDEVLALAAALRTRGARPWIIDLTGLPAVHHLEIRLDEPLFDGRSLREAQAFYLRRRRDAVPTPRPASVAGADPPARVRIYREWTALRERERELTGFIDSALELLPAPLVNPLAGQGVHRHRVHHLLRLAAAGVPVPPFLATNDPSAVEAFVERHGRDRVVLKTLGGFLKTVRLPPDPPHVDRLARRPVLLQRYVPGATVRAYALAGRVAAAGELVNEGDVDSSVAPRPPRRATLSEAESGMACRAARAAGLDFAGVDLQRAADGSGTFVLECNASPMFANFDRRTGAEVAGALADLLLERARTPAPPADAARMEER